MYEYVGKKLIQIDNCNLQVHFRLQINLGQLKFCGRLYKNVKIKSKSSRKG